MEQDLGFGPEAAKKRLLGGRGLSHAYILSGPAGSGKHALAEWMAAWYVCSDDGAGPCGLCSGCRKAAAGIHPDIIHAGEEDGTISAAAARLLRADAYIRPNEAPRKVYLLDRAQDMNPSAQNALLKVLEEGPPYAAFLLLTENAAALLPTIRSRCETLYLTPGGETVAGDEKLRETAGTLAGLLTDGGELELLTFSVPLEKWDRASLAALLDETLTCLRDKLVEGAGDRRRLLTLAGRIRTLRRACDSNIGAGHLAGWLAVTRGETQTIASEVLHG